MVAHIAIREDLALTYRIINHPECWQGYSCNPTLYSLFFQDNNMAHPPLWSTRPRELQTLWAVFFMPKTGGDMVLRAKIERVARDISQFKFAQMLDIDPQRWRRFGSGDKEPPQEVADKAAEVLGVPVEDLFCPVNGKVAAHA